MASINRALRNFYGTVKSHAGHSGILNKNIALNTTNKSWKCACYTSSRCLSSSLTGRDFLTLKDFSKQDIVHLLQTSADLKKRIKHDGETMQPFVGKSLGMIFEKRSTRTRVSTEVAFASLGGHAIFLSPQDIHLGVNESLRDTAPVLSGFLDAVFARVNHHSDLEALVEYGTVPVINGLSEIYHPLQSLADFLTLYEHFGDIKGKTLAWVGDGNNIIHSIMMTAPKLGVNLKIATPKDYECYPKVVKDTSELVKQYNTEVMYTTNAQDAVQGADVVVTDTWISMGQEQEKLERMKSFKGYQVTMDLCKHANPGWVFLHCLPRKAEEVDDDVFYSDKSLVFQAAENRKWTVMAVLMTIMGKDYKLKHSPKINA